MLSKVASPLHFLLVLRNFYIRHTPATSVLIIMLKVITYSLISFQKAPSAETSRQHCISLLFQGTFALATTFATPIAVGIAIALEFNHEADQSLCYFNFYGSSNFGDSKFIIHLVIGIVAWWCSQMWLCRHIWTPKNLRLERVQA